MRQAPTDLLPEDSEAHPWNVSGHIRESAGLQRHAALVRARERQEAQDAATAAVLYTWLLSAAHDNREENARLQPNLALAYSHFPTMDVFARFWQQVARARTSPPTGPGCRASWGKPLPGYLLSDERN